MQYILYISMQFLAPQIDLTDVSWFLSAQSEDSQCSARDYESNESNESNFIAMNYIDHIIGDVQASSWKRNELVFVYIHLHSGIVSTLFPRISMYDTKKQSHNALFKPNNAVSKFMTKGARSLGLWAPISVEMKQNIGRGAEEQEKCASGKCGLYCRYSANINTFVN